MMILLSACGCVGGFVVGLIAVDDDGDLNVGLIHDDDDDLILNWCRF